MNSRPVLKQSSVIHRCRRSLSLGASLLFGVCSSGPASAAALDSIADAALGAPDLTTSEFAGNPGAANRFAENGAGPMAVEKRSGRLFVADLGHHRVLSWPDSASFATGQAADVVIGQADMTGGDPDRSASRLHDPEGLALDRAGNLYVADAGNNRVLIFRPPFTSGMSASMVLGQPDFLTDDGSLTEPRNRLSEPSGLACDEAGNLWICDTKNNRIVFYEAPLYHDAIADGMVGHPVETPGAFNWEAYETNDATPAEGLYWPHGLAFSPDGSRLYVADHYNHRVVAYPLNTTARPWPTVTPGMAPVAVIGQSSLGHLGGRNREEDSGYEFGEPRAETLRFPIAVTVTSNGDLLVADSDNNRILFYPASSSPAGVALVATKAIGQADLNSKEYPSPTATSLNYPYAVIVDGWDNVLVTDQVNNRVLRYDQPFPLGHPSITALSPQQVFLNQSGPRAWSRLFTGDGYTKRSRLSDGTVPEYGGSRLFAKTDAGSLSAGTVPSEILPVAGGSGGSGPRTQNDVIARPGDSKEDGVLGQSGTTVSGPGAFDVGRVVEANGTTNHVISAANMENPSGVAVNPVDGRVFVADRVNHRILGWTSAAAREAGSEADIVIGQPDFFAHLPNRGATQPSAFSLNAPSGLTCSTDGRLYAADTGNHRVLEYRPPFVSGMGGGIYWGQTSAAGGQPNKGGAVSSDSFSQPTALAMDSAFYLAVADTGNNRVVVIKPPRELQLQPPVSPLPAMAVEVYGQPDFTHATVNNGGVSAHSLNAPKGVGFAADKSLWITDTSNHRVLYIPAQTRQVFGRNATRVLGQDTFTTNAPNRGSAATLRSLSGPAEVAMYRGVLAVADQANLRVLLFRDPAPDAEDDTADLSLTQATAPEALTFGSDRSLWVAQPASGRVLRWLEPLPDPFTGWNLGHFTDTQWLDPNTGDPYADPDRDGQVNLLEYALGTNPLVANAQPWPALAPGNLHKVLFPFDPLRSDIALHIDRSQTLQQWTPVLDTTDPAATGWGFQSSGGYWTDSSPPAGSKLFYRLRVILLP